MLVKRLYDSCNVRHVVMELGKSYAYLCNEYIKTGDSNILNILYPPASAPGNGYNHDETRGYLLRNMRAWYKEGKVVTVYGIDFERTLFLEALKHFLEKNKATGNTLYQYITSLPDTIQRLNHHERMWKERQELYKTCKTLYQKDQKYYDALPGGTAVIKEILTNPACETNFAGRDAAMYQNFCKIQDTATGNIFLNNGSHHIEGSRGKLYKKIAGGSHPGKDNISVISLLCKNCEESGYYFGSAKPAFSGNAAYIADTTMAGKILASCNTPGQLNIVATDDAFYKLFPVKKVENVDYLMFIECRD